MGPRRNAACAFAAYKIILTIWQKCMMNYLTHHDILGYNKKWRQVKEMDIDF